ncbi:hypothetical protein EV360DRAFT_83816 [Lentinula raphanica]|nr:hypothetical protein EV360DRAFT_83816 [Lentinula raphanica]
MDLNVLLCLACSSSLPPRSHSKLYMTQCCDKPICDSCISANPRLARYNPCLACLGGVQAVGSRQTFDGKSVPLEKLNIDGAVRDEDTFVLGDDDDDEDLQEQQVPPPPYIEQLSSQSYSSAQEANEQCTTSSQVEVSANVKMDSDVPNHSSEYHIRRGDTVHGIALRFGVDGRELCRLNKLPPSTLSTTPHLLHTRTVLTLPASARLKDKTGQSLLSSIKPEEERCRAVRRIRERAEKRLQTVTKEIDWRVAQAYIAIAEQEGTEGYRASYDLKHKELDAGPAFRKTPGPGSQVSDLELMALDKYFDDDEWEARERREGRFCQLSRLPTFQKS